MSEMTRILYDLRASGAVIRRAAPALTMAVAINLAIAATGGLIGYLAGRADYDAGYFAGYRAGALAECRSGWTSVDEAPAVWERCARRSNGSTGT